MDINTTASTRDGASIPSNTSAAASTTVGVQMQGAQSDPRTSFSAPVNLTASNGAPTSEQHSVVESMAGPLRTLIQPYSNSTLLTSPHSIPLSQTPANVPSHPFTPAFTEEASASAMTLSAQTAPSGFRKREGSPADRQTLAKLRKLLQERALKQEEATLPPQASSLLPFATEGGAAMLSNIQSRPVSDIMPFPQAKAEATTARHDDVSSQFIFQQPSDQHHLSQSSESVPNTSFNQSIPATTTPDYDTLKQKHDSLLKDYHCLAISFTHLCTKQTGVSEDIRNTLTQIQNTLRQISGPAGQGHIQYDQNFEFLEDCTRRLMAYVYQTNALIYRLSAECEPLVPEGNPLKQTLIAMMDVYGAQPETSLSSAPDEHRQESS